MKLGFQHVDDVEDPEVGTVWEWRWLRPLARSSGEGYTRSAAPLDAVAGVVWALWRHPSLIR